MCCLNATDIRRILLVFSLKLRYIVHIDKGGLMTLGERMKRLREKRGWNQRELARLAQVDNAWICRLEAGERHNISLDAAKRLAKTLGVSLDVLAGMHEEEFGRELAPAVDAVAPCA
jgi:transcriptional regulator with XRE-family HTH domain